MNDLIPEGWAFARKVDTQRMVLMRKEDGVEVSLYCQTPDDARSRPVFVWRVEHDTKFEGGRRLIARLSGSMTPAEAVRRVDENVPVLTWGKK